jgi:hypothetical protein
MFPSYLYEGKDRQLGNDSSVTYYYDNIRINSRQSIYWAVKMDTATKQISHKCSLQGITGGIAWKEENISVKNDSDTLTYYLTGSKSCHLPGLPVYFKVKEYNGILKKERGQRAEQGK